MARDGLELRSEVTQDGQLRLSLAPAPVPALEPDEVLVEVGGAPINPSDLGLLLGAADPAGARQEGSGAEAATVAPISPAGMRWMTPRIGQSLPVGNEGAGKVVETGNSEAARALAGKMVALWGGAMYARYRKAKAQDCLVLPEGTSAAEGASCFVNPLTALGMVETMRRHGHTGLVHTAAASNLGQMLNRICLADSVPLVNIVRRPEQVELLRGLGATQVVDSSASDFMPSLIAACKATGATMGFDAIGGGRLVNDILVAMEAVAAEGMTFSRYGSSKKKQMYIYGGLDLGPTELTRGYGFSWSLGGWLLPDFLAEAGPEVGQRLRDRVVAELKTTFASHYTKTIPLSGMLDPDNLRAFVAKSTGGKYLVDPTLE